MTHVRLALPEPLASAPFLGGTVADWWRRRLASVGLEWFDATIGPVVTVDGRFPGLDRELLSELATAPGTALQLPNGRVVATSRARVDPHEPAQAALEHPGGDTRTTATAGPEITDAWTLSLAERFAVDQHLQQLAQAGVRLHDPARIWVEPTVKVQPGAILWGGVVLRGATRIAAGAEVRSGAVLTDTEVGEGTVIKPYTICEGGRIGAVCSVGPMAHLRPGAVLHRDVKVGNFVEVKKTELHDGVRCSHLTYLGDAVIGAGANIGAGTITCNYDGFGKHRTIIGAGAFVGSNSSLVAPITLGAGVIVGAGSTLTRDVPDDALALERAEERVLKGNAGRIRTRNKARAEDSGHG